jgi:hypothetical protein
VARRSIRYGDALTHAVTVALNIAPIVYPTDRRSCPVGRDRIV